MRVKVVEEVLQVAVIAESKHRDRCESERVEEVLQVAGIAESKHRYRCESERGGGSTTGSWHSRE